MKTLPESLNFKSFELYSGSTFNIKASGHCIIYWTVIELEELTYKPL